MKKSKAKKNSSVDKLALEILTQDEDVSNNLGSEESYNIPEIENLVLDPAEYLDMPSDHKKEDTPTRVVFESGLNKNTAFVIHKNVNELHNILGHFFGNKQGDYFILNETTNTTYRDNIRKRYKTILVEDKNNFRYVLWFDLSLLGLIY